MGSFDTKGKGVLDDMKQLMAFRSLGCVDAHNNPPSRTRQELAGLDVQGFLNVVQRFREERLPALRKNEGFTDIELVDLRETFQKFDKDGDGDITKKELARLIEVLFPARAHAPEWRPYLMKLLSEIDADGSGSLDFSEFVCLMRKIQDHQDEEQLLVESNTVKELRFTRQAANEFRELFVAADQNGSCKLSFEDIRDMIARSLPLDHKQCDILYGYFYKAIQKGDNDGQADFLEFLHVIRMVIDAGWWE